MMIRAFSVALLLATASACSRGGTDAPGAAASPLPVTVEQQIDLLPRLGTAEPVPGSGRIEWGFPVLRDDQREALIMFSPGRVRFRGIPVHPRAMFEFGYGVAVPVGASSAPVTFRVEWIARGRTTELFSATLEALPPGRNEWHDAAVPLPAADAGGGDLVLAVEGPPTGSSAVAWSWPTVRSDGTEGPDDRKTVRAERRRIDLLVQVGEARLLAAPDGRRPGAVPVDLPDDLASRSVLVVPPGSGLAFRLDGSPGDLLRVRFHAAPGPGCDPAAAGGLLRLQVRARPGGAGAGEGAWVEVGSLGLRVEAGAPWRREARGELPLGSAAAGPFELELRVVGEAVTGEVLGGLSDLELVSVADVPRRTAGGGGRNVVVLLVDALRADHLGLYGQARATSPNLDRAAGQGLIFDRAFTASTWTLPAVASLLTGTLPTTHGVVLAADSVLPGDRMTISDAFRAAGYSTAAFVGNPLIGETHGFRSGFEDFEECLFMTAERLNARLVRWITAHRLERFFVYVHYMEPHAPYAAPEPFYGMFSPGYAGRFVRNTWSVLTDPTAAALGGALARGLPVELRDELGEQAVDLTWKIQAGPALFSRMTDLYDGEIRYWDDQFGRLAAALARLGLERDTIVVVVGDHGEEFAEHGRFGHGFDFHEETLRVPLVVIDPAETHPRRISGLTSLVDLEPILLERLGLPQPAGLDGWPLSRIEGPEGATRSVLAQTSYFVPDSFVARSERTSAFCVRDATTKVVYVPRDELWEGYRLDEDPGETRRLAADDPVVAARRAALLDQRARLDAFGPVEPRPAAGREQTILQALGYVR